MINKGISRSNLFMIELIIVIVFFAFAGTITLQLFLKANHITVETVGLNGAIMVAQTAAETAKSTEFEDLEKIPVATYYDKNWQPTHKEAAVYTLITKINFEKTSAGAMATFNQSITSNKESIYSLKSQKYYPDKGGASQ